MNVAVLHYHLKPGGVTSVIRHQVQALQGRASVLVLAGGTEDPELDVPTVLVGGLSYDADGGERYPPADTVDSLIDAMTGVFGGLPDLLHVHNPTLTKNTHLLSILDRLQRLGIPLLLHIHDFAEDGRPQAYTLGAPYPSDCHYATINLRDYRHLIRCGLKPEGLHLIPNPVPPLPISPPADRPPLVLYPVRAIRRKNIGEAFLLSHFLPEGAPLAITLPPNSPSDILAYERWKTLCRTWGLNVQFEAGLEGGFDQLVARSQFMLSTSITEGFGFAFLEPWTAGKAVHGRYLTGILEAFEKKGVNLSHLYPRIRIPLEWMDAEMLRKRFMETYLTACHQYGISVVDSQVNRFVKILLGDGWIDFGLLDEPYQETVIEHLRHHRSDRGRFAAMNPEAVGFGPETISPIAIAKNRRAVLGHFGLSDYGSRLLNIYRRVVREAPRHRIDKLALARCFLTPDAFSLLKWRPYEP
jgi:hypothetical protein